jgi:hypothetical protein
MPLKREAPAPGGVQGLKSQPVFLELYRILVMFVADIEAIFPVLPFILKN